MRVYDDDLDDGRRPGGGTGKTILVAALTSALTSTLVAFAVARLAAPPAAAPVEAKAEVPEDATEVPSITGLRTDQAREMCNARDLLLSLEDERDDPNVPAGAIISQTPLAGSRVKKKSEVRAIVSRGLSKVAVPDVVALTAEQAAGKLNEARLASGGVVQAESPNPPGTVIGTTPPAGTEVAPGTPVQIAISSGPGGVAVPKVTGMGVSKARVLLEQAGFQVGSTSYEYDENYAGNIVLRQRPPAGTVQPAGSKIGLVLNEPD